MENYTSKEAAEITGVSVRTIQRQVATIITDLTNTYGKGALVSEDVLNLLKWRQTNDTITILLNRDNNKET